MNQAPYDPNAAAQRVARLRNYAAYTISAPVQVIDADLACLRALADKIQARVRMFVLASFAIFFGLPLIGCVLSHANDSRGGPLIFGCFFGVVFAVISYAMSGRPLPVKMDKVHTAAALLRRIDFAAGVPVGLTAQLSSNMQRVASTYTPAGMWTNASRMTASVDPWLALEGRLSNSIALQVTRSIAYSQTTGRKGYQISANAAYQDTVILLYPPAMNPRLAQLGQAIGQQLRLPQGTGIEGLFNEPGSLSVRVTSNRPSPINVPHELTGLIAQLVYMIDPSRELVRVDRDMWPPYQPTNAELSPLLAARFPR